MIPELKRTRNNQGASCYAECLSKGSLYGEFSNFSRGLNAKDSFHSVRVAHQPNRVFSIIQVYFPNVVHQDQLSTMQNHAYLAAYLASNPNAAGVLLGSNANSLQGGAPLNNSANPLTSALSNELHAARSSALLNQLLHQQQIEEQQKALLAQHVAALTGSAAPLSESAILLALLRRREQQEQQAFQQQKIQELQACMALLESAPQQQPQGYFSGAADLTSEALAAAGLTGLANAAKAQEQIDDKGASSENILEKKTILSLPPDHRRKGRSGKFPQKLHQMLLDLERQGRSDIASFMPHGRSFAIHKPTEFAQEVMPKYFRMSRFSSFQRQLNLYDFQRITEGADKGTYYHELFLQGRPIVCAMMKRNKIKGVKQQQNNKKKVSVTVENTAAKRQQVSLDDDDEESTSGS
jgi:HSF-type DNA-binding